MNYKKNIVYILIIFFSIISISKSSENIAYLDLDNIVKNTKAGKSIIDKLKSSKDSALKQFEKKEKALKKVEEDINKQKNVLSKEELKNKISDFRKEIASFRNDREKLINDFNIKKIQEFEKFFKKITPIIGEYVEKKNIDIVLDKKNIFLANKNNDITNEIIKLIDDKIK
ncbi:OmpH family outer membrane protein [Pelagibacterales bacterium SAG-MED12]|nr:OmpH family outer membrane protein [Pelagibacterales bacterium SAG-MED12]